MLTYYENICFHNRFLISDKSDSNPINDFKLESKYEYPMNAFTQTLWSLRVRYSNWEGTYGFSLLDQLYALQWIRFLWIA